MDKYWNISAAAGANGKKKAKITFLGPISNIKFWAEDQSPQAVNDELKALGAFDEIELFTNSPGGSPHAASAIANLIRAYGVPITAHVIGWTASAATLLLAAADKVVMHPGSFQMIHEGRVTAASGKSEQLRAIADYLESVNDSLADIYAKRTGKSKEEMRELMKAETIMNAEQAVAMGFADELGSVPVAAFADGENIIANGVTFNPADYGYVVPDEIRASLPQAEAESDPDRERTCLADGEPVESAQAHETATADADDTPAEEQTPEATPEPEPEPAAAATPDPVAAERQRCAEIDALAAQCPGAEAQALAQRAKYEEPMTAAEFAVAVIKTGIPQRAAALAARQADSTALREVDGMSPFAPPESQAQADRMVEVATNHIKANVR